MVVPKCWELSKFEKKWYFIRSDCTSLLTEGCLWYICKIHLVLHCNNAVQEVVPLIDTHVNDKALKSALMKIKNAL